MPMHKVLQVSGILLYLVCTHVQWQWGQWQTVMLPADYLWCTLFCCRIERTVREHLMTLRSRFITRWNRHATRKLHSLLPRYTTQLLSEVCFSLFTSTVELEVHSQIIQISITFPNQILHEDNIVTEFSSCDFHWTSRWIFIQWTHFSIYSSACNLYSGYFYIPNPPSQFTLPSEMSIISLTSHLLVPRYRISLIRCHSLHVSVQLLFEGAVYYFQKPADISNSWVLYVWAI